LTDVLSGLFRAVKILDQRSRTQVPQQRSPNRDRHRGRQDLIRQGRDYSHGIALHLDQGIAVTGHASQAKTVDQVIASVPVRSFSQANEAQFYVTMSRVRWAMHVFTDSKVAAHTATRASKRLLLELVDLADQDRTLKAELAR
jgi:hypothetical protein